ncbi:LysR family transcriptional regulator [Cupriavidus basilensis]
MDIESHRSLRYEHQATRNTGPGGGTRLAFRAAKATGVAQSLVSRSIGQLEAEWGDRLFERTGRGVVLSEFGRRVFPQVQLLLAQSVRLQDEVKDAAGVPSGVVHVGVLPSMARRVVTQMFEDTQARAPGVLLHISEGFSGQLDEATGLGAAGYGGDQPLRARPTAG